MNHTPLPRDSQNPVNAGPFEPSYTQEGRSLSMARNHPLLALVLSWPCWVIFATLALPIGMASNDPEKGRARVAAMNIWLKSMTSDALQELKHRHQAPRAK